MKLCILTEYFQPDATGGTPAVLSELARYLADHYQDLQITVITSNNSYRYPDIKLPAFESWDGINIHRVPSPRSNRPSMLLRLAAGMYFTALALAKLLRLGRYDVVFVGTNPPAVPIAARINARLRKTPYIYLVHDLYPDLLVSLDLLPESHPITRGCRYLQEKWLQGSRRVIVLGRCMQDHLVMVYGLPRQQIEVIPNWSDPEQIVPLPKCTDFKRNHGLDGFIVLYAGNMGQHHGFDDIIHAAKILGGQYTDIAFVLVGDGDKHEHIAQRIEQERIANIRMFPFVPIEEFADLLASADVSLITLLPGAEGLGVPSKLYDIMASARPTVAIVDKSCEVARILEEVQCGIQVPHNEPNQLANSILQLFAAPDLANQMGENARKALEEKYTIAHIAEQYYQTFRQAVSSP